MTTRAQSFTPAEAVRAIEILRISSGAIADFTEAFKPLLMKFGPAAVAIGVAPLLSSLLELLHRMGDTAGHALVLDAVEAEFEKMASQGIVDAEFAEQIKAIFKGGGL